MKYRFTPRFSLPLLTLLCGCLMASASLAAAAAEMPAAAAHEGVSLKAIGIFHIGKFTVTNSMFFTWVIAAGIIVSAQVAMRNVKAIPDGKQNFWEWMVESLYNFLESIIGSELVRKTFWFFATLFILILFVNWSGLIPGIGTIGWGHHDPATGAFLVERPLLRGGNADLNMTMAMAIVFFVLWIYWALQTQGVGGVLKEIFGAKGESKGFMKLLMGVIFFLAGMLEIISILFRPVSLSFRLYGNVYAGETMLETMSHMVPSLAWLIPIPFYFMEVLVGIVQALVFMLLTAVFTLLIAQHQPGSEGAPH
ncbi:MAG TPA: F0F1 ATP synthase subunit A [Chthoniobacterales bacterium]|jgi:F-type H+-transporting ATPase subunit a